MNAVRTGPIPIALVAAGFLLFPAAAPALSPGDPADRVIDELGPPPNAITIGARRIYDYDRGRVEIENGIVVRADLISEAAAAERHQRRQEAVDLAVDQARLAEQQRREQGRALLAERLQDPRFMTAPAAERVAFFRSFTARHPDIPVAAEYREALWEAQRELNQPVPATGGPDPVQARELEQLKRDVLEARLRSLEAEQAVLQLRQATALAAPQTVVNVLVETPYSDIVIVPSLGPRRADPAPPPPADYWGRYSISRRLPPQGTPTFGGGAASGR